MTTGRRQQIIDAALTCFARKGVEATSIADIRAASGASIGSIYHHFGAKEDLAARVYLAVLESYRADLLKRLKRFETPQEYVEGIVRHFLSWVQRHQVAARFLTEMRNAPAVESSDADIRRQTAEFVQKVYGRLSDWMATGEIRTLPAQLLPALIIGPALTTSSFWLRDGAKGRLTTYASPLANAAWLSLKP